MDGSLMMFSKGKCQVLHLGRSNPGHQDRLGAAQLETACQERSLSLEMLKKLMGHQPEQPAVADPALSKRVGVDTPRD